MKKRKRADDEIQNLVRSLKKYDPEKIILFGSAARGETDDYSDLDVVVVKKTRKPFLKRLREAAFIHDLNRHVDILVYTPEEIERMQETESPFLEKVYAEGITLYEKSARRRKTLAKASRARLQGG